MSEAKPSDSTSELGEWKPERDTGYNAHARPWVLRRKNLKWRLGVETMTTVNADVRRWSTAAAAQKVADTANQPNTKLKDGHD